MLGIDEPGLVVGAVALGVVHGMEPGHGWPVAAAYAMEQSNKWLSGLAASTILGVGHLISSVAMVGAFFYAKSVLATESLTQPMHVLGVQVGSQMGLAAGVLLIALGIREYRHGHGHSHDHGDGHDHGHDHSHDHGDDQDHGHDHGHDYGDDHGHDHDHSDIGESHAHHSHEHAAADPRDGASGLLARLRSGLASLSGGQTSMDAEEADDRGLLGIAGFAFVLGFAHEEEFEIIGICTGSQNCLELMLIYALTVIGGIVALTMVLVAGFEAYEERVAAAAEYFPALSAAILIGMGLGFILGLF